MATVKCTMKLETITPETAEKYLVRNISNRRIQKITVSTYARLMRQGEWMVNGDAIRFDAEGNLLDGQHRLQAVMACGIPLETWVARGLENDSQLTVDQQRRRTAGDMLSMRGIVNGNRLAAIVRMVDRWHKGDRSMFGFSGSSATMLSTKEVVDETLRDPIYIDATLWSGRKAVLQLAPSRVIGTLYVLIMQTDPDVAEEFLVALESGANLAEGHPVLTLRRYWFNLKRSRSTRSSAIYLMAGVRAWNAFAQGRKLQAIGYKKTDIPEIEVPVEGRTTDLMDEDIEGFHSSGAVTEIPIPTAPARASG